jgi:hypothetical protein
VGDEPEKQQDGGDQQDLKEDLPVKGIVQQRLFLFLCRHRLPMI